MEAPLLGDLIIGLFIVFWCVYCLQVSSNAAAVSHGVAMTSKNSIVWSGLFSGFTQKNGVCLPFQTEWIE